MNDTSFTSVVKNGGKEVRLYPYVRRDAKTGLLEYSRQYSAEIEVYESGKRKKNYFSSLGTRDPVIANKLATEKHAEFMRIVESEKAKNVIPYQGRQEILAFLKQHDLIGKEATDIDLYTLQKIIFAYQEKFLASLRVTQD